MTGAPMGAGAPAGRGGEEKLKRSIANRSLASKKRRGEGALTDRPEFLTETDSVWGGGEAVSKPVLGD